MANNQQRWHLAAMTKIISRQHQWRNIIEKAAK